MFPKLSYLFDCKFPNYLTLAFTFGFVIAIIDLRLGI